MDESVLRFRVGVFVLFAFLILGVLIMMHIEGWRPQYSVHVKPQSAPGVTRNTPVRKNGLLIGRVSRVQTEDDHVVLELRIYDGENVYENEVCSIGTESILGDAVVEILPLPKEERGRLVTETEDQMLTRVSVKRNPLEIIDVALNLEQDIKDTLATINKAGESVDKAGQGIDQLASTVQEALGDDESDFKKLIADISAMSKQAKSAFERFDRIFEGLANIVEDPEFEGEVKGALEKLPKILDELRLTIQDTRTTINSFQEVSGKAATNLDNLEAFTVALKDDGPEILQQVNSSMKNVDGLIEQIGSFTKSLGNLGNSQGTLGKLINDDELYQMVRQTAVNVRDVSDRLEPLVNDLRMFADALARDPRQLGVKGAIERQPSNTPYKGTTTGRDRVFRR